MSSLRRSVSDPTELCSSQVSPKTILRRCASLVANLDQRVQAATAVVRYQTLSMSGPSKPGIGCKRCHGAVGKQGQHLGSRTGYNNCSLPHDPTCPGGVLEVSGKIAPCHDGYDLGMDFPGTAVQVPKGSTATKGTIDDEDYDSAASASSFSTQKSDELESESNCHDTDVNEVVLKLKDDVSKDIFQPPGILSSMFATTATAVTTTATITTATATINASPPIVSLPLCQATSTPLFTSSEPVNDGGVNVLMGFISQKMEEMKLQLRDEVSQAMSENDKKQAAIQQQLLAVQEHVHQVPAVSDGRRVQFNDETAGMLQDAASLRARMQADSGKRKLPDGLISMQSIRTTPGLAQQVEQRMQSVYTTPTLAAAPTASSSQPPPQGPFPGYAQPETPHSATGSSSLGPAVNMNWVEQQQLELRAYQQKWQEQQQQLLNEQLHSYQASLDEQNKKFQDNLQQQFSSSRPMSSRSAKSAAAATFEKQRTVRHNQLLQEEKTAEVEVTKLKKTLEQAKRRQKELRRKVNLETSGAEDDEGIFNRTLTSNNSTILDGEDHDVEFVTDPESGNMYEQPVYVKDPHTGIFRVKKSVTKSKSSHVAGHTSQGDMNSRRASQFTGLNQPLTGSVWSTPGAAQCPVPLPQQLRQSSAAANKQGKQSETEVPRVLTVSDWAKMCPTKSASSVTLKNMNLPMYLWGRLGELRAANAGICGSLPSDELEARLRHIQTVIQVCMQNSVPSDFTNYGWELARCYDQQIQTTMDSGLSTWVGFDKEFPRTAHPGFLMEADREVIKPVKKDIRKVENGDATGQKSKKICPVFNSCKQRKKCQKEVDNPDAGRCKLKHECSHCKKEHNKSVFHQAWWCNSGGKEAHAGVDED